MSYQYCVKADIDSLESERGELKDKMKQMSKKALLQGLSKETNKAYGSGGGGGYDSAVGGVGGPTSLGPSVPSPVRDSPLLLQQVGFFNQ